MAVATFVFWLGRHKFVHIPPGGSAFFREMFSGDGLRAILNLIPLYLFIIPVLMLVRSNALILGAPGKENVSRRLRLRKISRPSCKPSTRSS